MYYHSSVDLICLMDSHPFGLPNLRSLSYVWRLFHSGDSKRCWMIASLTSNAAMTGMSTNSLFSHHMDTLQTWSYWKERAPQGRFLGAAVVKARLTPNSRGSGTAGCSDVKVSGICTWHWAELTGSNSDFLSRKVLWHKFGHCSLLSRCKSGYLLFNQVCELFNIFLLVGQKICSSFSVPS